MIKMNNDYKLQKKANVRKRILLGEIEELKFLASIFVVQLFKQLCLCRCYCVLEAQLRGELPSRGTNQ